MVHVFACSGFGFLLNTMTAVGLARMCGRPVIVHYHSGDADAFARRHPRAFDAVMRSADALVVPSGFLEEIFARRGHSARVIPNPLDVDAFRYIARDVVVPVVLSCRNLFRKYDLASTLRAFAPSRFDNFPGSILEAMSSGLPVVSTDVGGIPWLLRDGESGKLAARDDIQALADHLSFLADNPVAARRLAAAARASVESLRWERVAALWRGLYGELLRGAGRPRRAAGPATQAGTAPTPTR